MLVRMAAYVPHGNLLDGMKLKDGLLGASVGWRLKKARILFWHGLSLKGTEMDFVTEMPQGKVLIECKMLSVSLPPKQLARNIRQSLKQLSAHATLLENESSKVYQAICLVNLTQDHLNSLRRSAFPLGPDLQNLMSYERFPRWLLVQTGHRVGKQNRVRRRTS